MPQILPHHIMIDNAPPELVRAYRSIESHIMGDRLEKFTAELDSADSNLVNTVNQGGYTLFGKTSQAFHECGSAYQRIRLAGYMDRLIQKWPALLSPEDAWMEFYGIRDTQHKYYVEGSAAVNALLQRLTTTYALPENDDVLWRKLRERARDVEPFRRALERSFPRSLDFSKGIPNVSTIRSILNAEDTTNFYRSMLRDFPRSLALCTKEAEIERIFGLYGAQEFEKNQPLMMLALDHYAAYRTDQALPRAQFISHMAGVMQRSNSRDFWADVTRRLIDPVLIRLQLDRGVPIDTPDIIHTFSDGYSDELCKSMVQFWLEEGLSPSQVFERNEQLSRSWHHEAVKFAPSGLEVPEPLKEIPLPEQEWCALLPEPYVTRGGKYVLRSYTTEAQLKKAHEVLKHCVDEYTSDCMEGKSHIVGIEDAKGNLHSTAEIQIMQQGDPVILNYSFVPVSGVNLVVIQHERRKIRDKAQLVEKGPLHKALHEWLNAASAGEVAVNTTKHGATEEYEKQVKAHSISAQELRMIRSFGFYPTWHNIERAFHEFKKNLRGGSVGVDEHNRLVYPEQRVHLIDGTVVQDGRRLQLRDMTALEWMRAIGLMGRLAAASSNSPELKARLHEEEKKPFSASGRAYLGIAYAMAAGTLAKKDLRHLTRAERKGYEARLRRDRKLVVASRFVR